MTKLDKLINSVCSVTDRAMRFADQNAPTILTGFGVLGLFGTAVLSYRAALEAKPILDEKKKAMEYVEPNDKAAKRAVTKETITEVGPIFAKPIIAGVATTACIVGSNRVSNKRLALISAAYSLTETALKERKEKEKAVIGEDKAKRIREAISKDNVLKDPPPENSEQIIMTGAGNVLCKDLYSGRYFYSTTQKIGMSISKLSSDCQMEMTVSLNDFYAEIGIDQVPMGDDLGWALDDLERGIIPISYTAVLTEDGRPCVCVEYEPRVLRRY